MRPEIASLLPISGWVSVGYAFAQGWWLAGTGMTIVATAATTAYVMKQILSASESLAALRDAPPMLSRKQR
ncbi:MAG: hypothetical protein QOD77_638 [Thermoplasmata archaeon]|nr:hypothetical protein [Thermoplasmata archaeon]